MGLSSGAGSASDGVLLGSELAEITGSGLCEGDAGVTVGAGESDGVDSEVGATEGLGIGDVDEEGIGLSVGVVFPHSPCNSFTNPTAASCAIKHPGFPC